MFLEPGVIAELFLLGALGGFLAGLLGIGGGIVLVPFLTFILNMHGIADGLSVKMAIATASANVVFTTLLSAWAHQRRGLVQFAVVKSMLPGILLGASLVSLGVFSLLKGAYLAVFFGLFIGFCAWRMLFNTQSIAQPTAPGTLGFLGIGTAVGFLSGLVGAGGGFLNVPYLVRSGFDMRRAVATSAMLGVPIALVNTAGFVFSGQLAHGLPPYALGYLYLPALLALICSGMLFVPLGAKASYILPVTSLKKAFALLLFALAVYMLATGVSGLI